MTRQKVSDPALLAQLGQSPRKKVTDPSLLAQLNSEEPQEDTGSYLDNLPEPEGFFSKLPRNIITGLANLGHSTLNTPHDVARSTENALQNLGAITQSAAIPLPSNWPKREESKEQPFRISDYIPKQQEYDYAKMLGQPGEGTLMDQLIQKGVEYLPEIAGGSALLRGGFRRLKGTHQLDKVAQSIKESGMKNFSYAPETLEEARGYMPNTQAAREAFEKSAAGEYPASFSIQSQIGHHQRNLAKSPLASERLMAPQVGDLKQTMLGELEQILRASGKHSEADELRQGIGNYATYMKVKNAVMPIIKKFGIPTSIAAALGFGYEKSKQALR